MAVISLHVEIDQQLAKRLARAIPRGLKSAIIRILVEALVDEIERNGQGILGPMLAKKFDIRSIVQNLNTGGDDVILRPSEERGPDSGIDLPWGEERSTGVPGRESRTANNESQESTRAGEEEPPLSNLPKGTEK